MKRNHTFRSFLWGIPLTALLTLPALGGSSVNIVAFVIVVYDLFFVQQAHAVKAENKDRL